MSVTHATPYGAGPTKVGGTQWDEPHTANNGEFAQTGDFKQAMRASAPTGWITASGTTTIGNVGSGATRANVDTLALFTLWWTDFSDALCPLLTSAGAGSTRGASAAADWAALKRLTVFDAGGRFARVPGTINSTTFVAGTKYADTFKSHTHASASGSNLLGSPGAGNVAYTGGTSMGADTLANTGGAETAPVSLAIPGFWKL